MGMAQSKYFTKAGKISFYSKSPMENIEAINNSVVSVWDVSSGQIEFAVLMKGFEFEKALMQEHFNENYVESDKYPKAVFKGIIENSTAISFTTDNVVTVKVKGSLSLHGITNAVNTTAVITVKNGVVAATSNFSIALADYKISIPSVVANKINKTIAISVIIPAYQLLNNK
jgi:polyisoprenoid-binding protein YceI